MASVKTILRKKPEQVQVVVGIVAINLAVAAGDGGPDTDWESYTRQALREWGNLQRKIPSHSELEIAQHCIEKIRCDPHWGKVLRADTQ
jgi:hypothetical protein